MNTKMAVVGGVALVSVGLAGWMTYKSFGPKRELRTPEAARAASTPEIPQDMLDDVDVGPDGERSITLDADGLAENMGWVQDDPAENAHEYTFPKVSDADEAAAALRDDFEVMVQNVVSQSVTTPEGGWRPLMDTWRSLMMPVVAGNEDAFVRAARTLGAITDSPEERGASPASALYARLSAMLKGSPIDAKNAVVRDIDSNTPRAIPSMPKMTSNFKLPANAIPMMKMVVQERGPDGVSRETHTMDMPLGNVFPNAQEALDRDARALEVWAPALVPGTKGTEPDIGFSTIMVRDARLKRWVPIGLRIRLMTERSRDHAQDALRPREEG